MHTDIREYAEYLLKGLVDTPEKLSVSDMTETEQNVVLTVSLPSDNVGQVMGQNKHLEKTVKKLLRSAYAARGKKHRNFTLEFNQQ